MDDWPHETPYDLARQSLETQRQIVRQLERIRIGLDRAGWGLVAIIAILALIYFHQH